MIIRAALAAAAGIGSLVAQATFTSTIGLGSLIVGMLVVILFGVFSLRDRRNSGWKDLYEQEVATAKQEREKADGLLERLEEERVVRHDIKDELATVKAQLLVEQAKPDLGEILQQQRLLWTETLGPLTITLKAMQATQVQMLALLTERGTP